MKCIKISSTKIGKAKKRCGKSKIIVEGYWKLNKVLKESWNKCGNKANVSVMVY